MADRILIGMDVKGWKAMIRLLEGYREGRDKEDWVNPLIERIRRTIKKAEGGEK